MSIVNFASLVYKFCKIYSENVHVSIDNIENVLNFTYFGCDCMVVGFITTCTCAINAYHH